MLTVFRDGVYLAASRRASVAHLILGGFRLGSRDSTPHLTHELLVILSERQSTLQEGDSTLVQPHIGTTPIEKGHFRGGLSLGTR
jgi:hypothetical protein